MECRKVTETTAKIKEVKDKTVRWDPGYPSSNPRLDIHQQRFLMAAKAFAQCHNHSRH